MTRSLALVGVALAMIAVACSDPDAGTTTSAPAAVAPSPAPTPSSTTSAPPASPVTTTAAPTTTSLPPPPSTNPPSTTTTTSIPPASELRVRLQEVGRVEQPVLVTAIPGDSGLVVVDQPGRIWLIEGDAREVVLDIRGNVGFGGERGLLGMAFHPDFAANRLFYVNYTNRSGNTIIAEYRLGASGRADPESRRVVLRVGQPAGNHNGGMIAFGPEGYLFIGMGDGGGANDQFRTARDPNRLNGALLRIEVGPGAPQPYGIPADNPYAGSDDGRDEVWAIGVRNPWRFAIDGDRLYVADVGQNRIEEISVASTAIPGLDFGWSVMEGDECFRRSSCDASPFVLPVYTYTHGPGCSITGGVVYRGSELPEIDGHYFFADYCAGWVRSIVVDQSGTVVEELEWPDLGLRLPTGFGVDEAGEMYVVSQRGPIYKVVRGSDG